MTRYNFANCLQICIQERSSRLKSFFIVLLGESSIPSFFREREEDEQIQMIMQAQGSGSLKFASFL